MKSFALLLLTGTAFAQSGIPAPMTPLAHPDPRLAALYAPATGLHTPTGVALSPDGTTLAWTIAAGDSSILHLTDVTSSKEKLVAPTSKSPCSSTLPVWSPDSQTLAFTATCATSDQAQLYLWSRPTGTIRQLTHLTGIFHQAAFSPDGRSLAFLFVENATRSAGALAPMKPWSGVIGEDGIETQRVYAVATTTGKGDFLTPANLHVFEFDYSPSTPEIAYIAANPPGENNWWVAKLFRAATSASATPTIVFDPTTSTSPLHGLQIAVPRFSPDGKQIAFIGGLMSDQGSTGGDVWVIPATGGSPTDITPNIDGTPSFETWLSNDVIGMVEDRRGHTVLPDYQVSTRSLLPNSPIDLGETVVTGGPIKDAVSSSLTTRRFAFIQSGHATPPEIWTGGDGGLHQVTHLNDNAKPPVRVESIEWENEGFHVQGWLSYPVNYDPAKKYPLIVNVHGGPSASAGARWSGSNWAKLGYFELAPNPRGSFGQGETFTAANRKDFGYGDLRDILAGLDAVEKKVSVDPQREGLTGWSYGGFMTMFAVTQTHRFRAAVAGAGISDWKSYYGQNSIDQWMTPFFGATVYDDPAVYAKSSAIEFIKQVKTPTLILVGDRDGECPAPQSFEFWHALRAEGVKTQLVVYPNEGHGFLDQAHIRDRQARELAWFEQEMPAR